MEKGEKKGKNGTNVLIKDFSPLQCFSSVKA